MAKTKLRTEKNCLNCGTEVMGVFCHECGQKNIEPRRPLWEIPWAFIEETINIDGKFLKSLKRLLFFPGFLSKEYINGRRHSYNDPVRIYLVTSFIFFIVFSTVLNSFKTAIDDEIASTDLSSLNNDTTQHNSGIHYNTQPGTGISYKISPDSPQDTASVIQTVTQTATLVKSWIDEAKNTLPYLFWISLPFFALALKLIYIRRKVFYWDHLVFALGLYAFYFLLYSVGFALSYLVGWVFGSSNLVDVAILILTLLIGGVYLFTALKYFYQQGFVKTSLKFILLNIIVSIILMTEFIVFIGILASQAENLPVKT